MWKRIILILLAVLVGVPAAGLAYLYLRKPSQAPAADIKVPMTAERIAQGRFLFTTLADCDGCHSERDFTRVGGPVVESGRGQGNVMSQLLMGMPGTVVAPNLTPDMETGLGKWTDGEKIRAIREGVDREGRALFPMMPYSGYKSMSDDDVQSVVAYMNTLPAIRNALPPTKLDFPVNLMIKGVPEPAGSVPPPERRDRVNYGRYLVTVGGCEECHTPTERGQPVGGKAFAGGEKFPSAAGTVVSANITPDLETGIGKWTEENFLKKFYDYREYAAGEAPKVTGPEQFTVMPWLSFCQLPPEDLGAIYAFLRTVKPVPNSVETHPGTRKQGGAGK